MMTSVFGLTMPLFGDTASPYDEVVEKVTAETCTAENWTLILDICDRVVSDQPKGGKLCLLSIKKRLNHRDPHVVLLALSLLDSLWNNCDINFRREVSSREFTQELGFKAQHSNRFIAEKTRSMIKKWSESECKNDASLGLIKTLYKNLLEEGHTFDTAVSESKQSKVVADPNVVENDEEEVAVARAIANSLEETKRNQASGIYPSAASASLSRSRVEREVRALYDFEAAEDNELTFSAGDFILVTDDSDANWWKGRSSRGEGFFPASFVTTDIRPLVQQSADEQSDPTPKVSVARIDKSVLMECLRMLEDCDPTGERPDPPELADLEHRSLTQAPLIDARLAEIDRQHNALAQVDIAIRDVLAMYDQAVQQVQYNIHQQQSPHVSSGMPYTAGAVAPTPPLNGPSTTGDTITQQQQWSAVSTQQQQHMHM